VQDLYWFEQNVHTFKISSMGYKQVRER
jgi:hypothetical protein